MDPALRDQIEYGERVLHAVISRAIQLNTIGTEDDAGLVAVQLHLTVIELFACCNELAMRSRSTGVPILVRSMLEALIELENFGKYGREYYPLFEASTYKELLKFANAETVGPYLSRASKEKLAGFAARRDELRTQGVRALKIEERFERVDRGGEYRGMYGLLCMEAHNHAGALADRHMKETERGIEMTILADPEPVRVAIRLNIGAGYVIHSAQIIHALLHTASVDAMNELGERHKARPQQQTPAPLTLIATDLTKT